MKKQDNESLIQELTKRLDWYIMKASDEEFDADEVQTLMKLLDNLKTEEDNVEDELPVEEALDDFWKHCEEREEEERLLLGTEKVNLLQRKRRTSPGRVSFIKCSGTFADADLR